MPKTKDDFFYFYHAQQRRFLYECRSCSAWHKEKPERCHCKEDADAERV